VPWMLLRSSGQLWDGPQKARGDANRGGNERAGIGPQSFSIPVASLINDWELGRSRSLCMSNPLPQTAGAKDVPATAPGDRMQSRSGGTDMSLHFVKVVVPNVEKVAFHGARAGLSD
jgi:hypothetical protein